MKKYLSLIIFFPFLLVAKEDVGANVDIYRSNTIVDPTLKDDAAIFEFQFQSDHPILAETEVYYSIDGIQGTQLAKNGMITIPAVAGKHIFQFYYSNEYPEVFSDSLQIEAKHRDRYIVNLTYTNYQNVFLKPVIYLYPETSTEVDLKIDVHGEDPIYYPAYTDSWKFTAEANGDLHFGDETYNYLFWEATRRSILSPKQTASGFFVKGQNATEFLEEKLTSIGFNSKERADFITFWGPRLAQNNLNFIHFEFNEECQQYADLTIDPSPDNLYRLFMVWGSVSEAFNVTEQKIEQFNRAGFSVLEWGGQESHIKQSFYNKNK